MEDVFLTHTKCSTCHFRDTVNTTWEIPGVSGSDEGFYDCVAISSSGTGIGRLYLVVTGE